MVLILSLSEDLNDPSVIVWGFWLYLNAEEHPFGLNNLNILGGENPTHFGPFLGLT